MSDDKVISGDVRNIQDFIQEFRSYKTIILNPPWWYADQRKERKDTKTPTKGIGACHHYSLLKEEELAQIPISQLCADRCHVFLWATCPLLDQAMRLIQAWGLTYCTVAFIWVKTNPGIWKKLSTTSFFVSSLQTILKNLTFFGPGYYTGSNIELVLLARKGKPYRHGKHKAPQVIYAPRRSHSEKPEEAQDAIEAMYPEIKPRLELFARRQRTGWDVFGNEL